MNVSIIIVNYNSTEFLEPCLKSILEHTKGLLYEIIVIDNNSTSRDIELIQVKFPTVKLVLRKINDGFGAGCNVGFKLSSGKYICLVNPDIIIRNNVLLNFFKYMESNDEVMCCSCLQEDSTGKLSNSYDFFPDLLSEIKQIFNIGIKKHLRQLNDRLEIKNNTIFDVDYHIGAFLFLRSVGYKLINGFDERFFLYSEDIDFGLRLKQIGKRVVCISSERVYHFYNCTVQGNEGKYLRTYHINRSKLIYYYKHFGFLKRNVCRVLMIIGISMRLIYLPFNVVHKGARLDGYKRISCGMKIFFKKYNIKTLSKLNSSEI